MYDEPDDAPDDAPDEQPGAGRPRDPAQRAREKVEELRVHAELAAVFEGVRKFGVELRPGLDAGLAREVQQTVGRLEKAKLAAGGPVITGEVTRQGSDLLAMPHARNMALGDYHVHRRPGEAMVVRWLEGEQVEAFYERFQAHFDAALNGHREDERANHAWRQDPAVTAYLEALEGVRAKMADWYLRDVIKKHGLVVLSTVTADEIDILHLCDFLMGVPAAAVVGEHSAPPADDPTERDRAWYFKLFSLRGAADGLERMCFFAFLQKAGDEW